MVSAAHSWSKSSKPGLDLVENLLNEMELILVHDPYLAEPQQHSEIIDGLKKRDKLGSQEIMNSQAASLEMR